MMIKQLKLMNWAEKFLIVGLGVVIVWLILLTVKVWDLESVDDTIDEKFVYITATGKKYHREDCRYLTASQRRITLDAAMARGLESCKVCKP